jgi:hypothetical protein
MLRRRYQLPLLVACRNVSFTTQQHKSTRNAGHQVQSSTLLPGLQCRPRQMTVLGTPLGCPAVSVLPRLAASCHAAAAAAAWVGSGTLLLLLLPTWPGTLGVSRWLATSCRRLQRLGYAKAPGQRRQTHQHQLPKCVALSLEVHRIHQSSLLLHPLTPPQRQTGRSHHSLPLPASCCC